MSCFLLTKDQKTKSISRVLDYVSSVQESESLAILA